MQALRFVSILDGMYEVSTLLDRVKLELIGRLREVERSQTSLLVFVPSMMSSTQAVSQKAVARVLNSD